MDLKQVRQEIDETDEKILELFLRRMALGKEAMREKAYCGKPLVDQRREREILTRIAEKSGALSSYAVRLFETLMALSREYQGALSAGAPVPAPDPAARNIVIIGMPGSGKSTVAALISEKTGRQFVNIDTEIVRRAGKTIPEIFAEDGEPAFRALEREVTARAGALDRAVIATGGGVVKDERNYAPLHRNGRIYYLRRVLEELEIEGRPLSKNLETLRQLEIEREPLYCRFADAEIKNDVTLAEAAERIWAEFCADCRRPSEEK